MRREKGQVFTLDMLFALILVAMFISVSGQVYESATGQARSYSIRYSLERVANDAADALIKTPGEPENWEGDTEILETLGLAEENNGDPVQNTVSIMKFERLRHLTSKDGWMDSVNDSAVEVIREFFGGSSNFEVRILDENENGLWHAFPMWEPGKESGVENSLEVAVVRRLIVVKYGAIIRKESGLIERAKAEGPYMDNLEFDIHAGELDAFDWYIVVRGGGKIVNIQISVNREPVGGTFDYKFGQSDMPERIYPNPDSPYNVEHGGIENDDRIGNQLDEGTNFLGLKLTAKPEGGWVKIYVVMLPSCSEWTYAALPLQPSPAILEVRVWR